MGKAVSTARFTNIAGTPRFVAGACTCPVAHNCKHVVAIVVAANDRGTRYQTPAARPSAAVTPIRQPSWEASLRALVDTPLLHASGASLAIELRVDDGGSGRAARPRLLARLMRPAARGGWVNGSLDWNGLDSWRVEQAKLRPDHAALARELGAVQRAAEPSWRYRHGAEKVLDLTDCGPQLWSMLDEAARIGLPLIHAGPHLDELAPVVTGEIVLDVTRGNRAGALVRAQLRVGDDVECIEAVTFLGAIGHGVVCADPTDAEPPNGRLRLVRLVRPAPLPLQRMVLDGRSLTVPATDVGRFADDVCLALQRVASVVSSDESFTPPVVSPPSLALRVSYGERHTVELAWQWAYDVGEATRFVPLEVDGTGAGFRDVGAERALVAVTDLRESGLVELGLADDRGRPVAGPSVSLLGLRCMRFATEDLPRLLDLGVPRVDVNGAPSDYRDVAESIEIGVATADLEGERDWFGLSVTIAVEGRVLPFADVFVALATGESHVLLDDGAHFSLDDPRLQTLRQLIEEARSLVARRRRRCASAATRPASGPSLRRSASSPSSPMLGSGRPERCSLSTTFPTTRRPDEAQNVKNHQAKAYRCVRELDAPVKLALSGTPMENNLMELWSLLSITAPGLFPDPKSFAEHYARPIERGDADRLARLRRRIKPLVKRRTKELVAPDLPTKQEQSLEVDLHPRHRKVYDTQLQRERQRVLGLLGDFDRNRFTILRSITLLRQLSLHAALADGRHDNVPCAKIGALAEQLDDVMAGGHRALVFSQFTSFLTKVRADLDRAGVGYCYLDGRTRNRQRVLERFRDGDDPVFLISLKAGGSGLNLTEADYCFLLDPWWNPATENQAIDRAHRIGQTRPVMVYRLIAKDTIEEKVVALARRKTALFKGVMDDGDLFASSLTADDIRGLFS